MLLSLTHCIVFIFGSKSVITQYLLTPTAHILLIHPSIVYIYIYNEDV